jgi:crotonobetainyl-CoA:carnitine CoA-transferase CaiB-like acyl-CoA transferase
LALASLSLTSGSREPAIVAGKTSSMTGPAAMLAAVHDKARTGQGQEVEGPMFERMRGPR